MKLAIIIPTRNRDVERLIKNIKEQSYQPAQVLVVDGSNAPGVYEGVDYFHTYNYGLAKQKNLGVSLLRTDIDIVCFLDDDIVLMDGALKEIMNFWRYVGKSVGGVGFNIINEKRSSYFAGLKAFFQTGHSKKGLILRSGYNSSIHPVENAMFSLWISGGASTWRKEVFDEYKFDEEIEGRCEDIDFSFSVGKKYALMLSKNAKVKHFPVNPEGEKTEQDAVTNRWRIVSKDRYFSKGLFFWATFWKLVEHVLLLKFSKAKGLIKGLYGLKRSRYR